MSSRTSDKIARCNRFVLAQSASGFNQTAFAKRVGLTPSQFTNIKTYRNLPPRDAVVLACQEFGFTTDYFERDERAGFRDPKLAEKLRDAERKPKEKPAAKRRRRPRKVKEKQP